jgi:hypothetical protein
MKTLHPKKARHDQIADWATEMTGTDLDLDPDLEAAGIEQLVKAGTLSSEVSAQDFNAS